jgi:hypothetical protein
MVPAVATEKTPATPLGIDSETFRLAAQCLNHYAKPGPIIYVHVVIITINDLLVRHVSTRMGHVHVTVKRNQILDCVLHLHDCW